MPSIRDPVHGFVDYDKQEEAIINSQAFQRLRFIGQLATTPWLYPGTKHSRFEHSIGVMHVATRILDKVWDKLSTITNWDGQREGMRKVLRLGALLHDVGHPAFSHAFEDLLPNEDHEYFTGRYILEDEELNRAFRQGPTGVLSQKVAVIALGSEERKDFFPDLLDFETAQLQFLNQILTSDLLGADRMDYLLRDSLHAGVTYGHYDLDRVLDTITVVEGDSGAPELAIERGGLEAAEGLILARYYMFSQVYFHHVRTILDEWIERAVQRVFSEKIEDSLDEHKRMTDDVVQVKVRDKWLNDECPEGRVFFERKHPRLAYKVPNDRLADTRSDELAEMKSRIEDHLSTHFSDDDRYVVKVTDEESVGASVRDVPVVRETVGLPDEVNAFGAQSRVLSQLPRIQAINVFATDRNDRAVIKRYVSDWAEGPQHNLFS